MSHFLSNALLEMSTILQILGFAAHLKLSNGLAGCYLLQKKNKFENNIHCRLENVSCIALK